MALRAANGLIDQRASIAQANTARLSVAFQELLIGKPADDNNGIAHHILNKLGANWSVKIAMMLNCLG